MNLDNLRIFVLPNDLRHIKTIKIKQSENQDLVRDLVNHIDTQNQTKDVPYLTQIAHPRTLKKSLFLQDPQNLSMYELKKVSGTNPHLSKDKNACCNVKPLQTSDGKSIKTILIEDSCYSNGLVLLDPTVFVATKFNIAYLLISFFQILNSRINDDSSIRHSSIEDIIDSLSNDPNFSELGNFPIQQLIENLEKICDVITENDSDKFYKFSESKTLQFLTSKIDKLSYPQNFPVSLIHKIVNPSITPADITQEIPADISQIAITKSSIHLLSSYLLPSTCDQLNLHYNDKLHILNQYKNSQLQKNETKSLAMENLNEMNQLIQKSENDKLGGSRFANDKKKKIAKDNKLKKQQKVVKKGALDRFFKKK